MNRRAFLRDAFLSSAAISAVPGLLAQSLQGSEKKVREFLRGLLYTEREVDQWLAGKAFPFAKYSSEFGWLLPNARFRDGIDDSVSTYTFAQPDGERVMRNYATQPCRINTYGDSFTQCHRGISSGKVTK